MADIHSPLSKEQVRELSRQQDERMHRYRNVKICNLEASCYAVGVVAFLFGLLWLVVGYNIPYYQENGLMSVFWVPAIVCMVVGIIFVRWLKA